MEWTVVGSVRNPWGQVPMSAGGASLVPRVAEYMDRVKATAAKRDCVSRRHHYVPQSYLRAWSADGRRVRVLDTRNGLDHLRGLRDTCVEEDFYRVTDATDTPHNQVEAMLAVLDAEAASIIRRFRAWAPGEGIDFDEFMSLAVLVALQSNRTPQSRRILTDTNEWQSRRAGQPAQPFTTDHFVDSLFRSIHQAADEVSTRQLELWDDPRQRFITTDQPVLLSPSPDGSPPGMLHSRYVWWPLGPERLLVLSSNLVGEKAVHRTLPPREVDDIRRAFIRGAESVIIAKSSDRDLPSGKVLARRPQLQIDCEPVDVAARKCRIRMARGFGATTLDYACRPLCAMTGEPAARVRTRR